MNIVKLTKIIGVSAVASQACLFADTYKLEVTKDVGETKVRFRIENLTNDLAEMSSFSFLSSGHGDIVDCVTNNGVAELSFEDPLLKFKFGTFRVRYDRQNKTVQLHNGSFLDSLVVEKCDFPLIVGRNKYLLANTLLMKDISFKNEGTCDAAITLFQDCKSVENHGDFWSRNLFLSGSCFVNEGRITHNDILKQTNDGKLSTSWNSENNRFGVLRKDFETNTARDLKEAPRTGERTMVGASRFLAGFGRTRFALSSPVADGEHTPWFPFDRSIAVSAKRVQDRLTRKRACGTMQPVSHF